MGSLRVFLSALMVHSERTMGNIWMRGKVLVSSVALVSAVDGQSHNSSN